MRKRLFGTVLSLLLMSGAFATHAQTTAHQQNSSETFGNTLNLGIGPGYFGYMSGSAPFIFANYEFDVLRNFTLAPFIGFTSYQSSPYYYSGNNYYYRETVIPIGVKGTYYFDELLDLNPHWDIYAAASLGFAIDNVSWSNGYTGDKGAAHTASPLYLDIHAGAEYHVSHKVGLFLDLSTGVTTFGIAIHHLN